MTCGQMDEVTKGFEEERKRGQIVLIRNAVFSPRCLSYLHRRSTEASGARCCLDVQSTSQLHPLLLRAAKLLSGSMLGLLANNVIAVALDEHQFSGIDFPESY